MQFPGSGKQRIDKDEQASKMTKDENSVNP